MQMGQREDVVGVGAGTVWIGRKVVDDIGGVGLFRFGGWVGEDVGGGCDWVCGGGEARDTVSVIAGGWEDGDEAFDVCEIDRGGGRVGRPETMGGGRSKPSAAFLESCRAKSEACHHSRNFNANMEVGRSIFKLESRRGYIIDTKVEGLKMLDPWPGRAPAFAEFVVGGCSAKAIARWSASPSRRMRVPTSQRKGEEYFELSNR